MYIYIYIYVYIYKYTYRNEIGGHKTSFLLLLYKRVMLKTN